MPVTPLPQFEADLAEHLRDREDREAYERLRPPTSVVVRFGVMKLVGEFAYDGSIKPGCGSRLVVRTHRGVELGEMLTSTCPNSGCSKSVSRQEMLRYIENSGGRDYPFFTQGRVLRIAGGDDLDRQARLDQSRHGLKVEARSLAEQLGVPVRIVEAEPILGGERMTFYFTAEGRPETRDLVQRLGERHRTRVDLRQVGARDEARLTADYERCGQYCCCKNFLKVLKPVSMRSAKVQKATLDPLKISGRCGRLMCCLRYEDQTYEELRRRLPRSGKRVGTPDGPGIVLDTQILTQLALVRLDSGREHAYPVENLGEPEAPTHEPVAPPADEALPAATGEPSPEPPQPRKRRKRRRGRGFSPPAAADDAGPARPEPPPTPSQQAQPSRPRRRRRRRGGGGGGAPGTAGP
jgi:cell fate regulator YaaT (PSP1 superfamily)